MDGLNLELRPGLNTIIGPRGSGKTSIIELIRFALGVQSADEGINRKAEDLAAGILESGRVTVYVTSGQQTVRVSRSPGQPVPEVATSFRRPLIFSQQEIERVGVDPVGRLRVLDALMADVDRRPEDERGLVAKVKSLTVEISRLRTEVGQLEDELSGFKEAKDEAAEAEAVQAKMLAEASEAAPEREALDELAEATAENMLRQKLIQQASKNVATWARDVARIADNPGLPSWPTEAGQPDLLAEHRVAFEKMNSSLEDLSGRAEQLVRALDKESGRLNESRVALDAAALEKRKRLDELESGAGAAAQKLARLRERLGELKALRVAQDEKKQRIQQLHDRRREVLNELDALREDRFSGRQRIGNELTKTLGPAVRIAVEKGAHAPSYSSAIQHAIRGSGMHAARLAPQLAKRFSPRELAERVEKNDAASIADRVGISTDRAQKLVGVLQQAGVEGIVTARIDDAVRMFLLDGGDYKPTPELSMGQRCTVVLSVLLAAGSLPLIVDQPEDHLDNAFVVETLVKALLPRKAKSQVIFTTHNPNIPVLGDAEEVVVLASDGKHGFVQCRGPLDDPDVVESITALMEGGREAFQRRARFYGLFGADLP